MNDEQKQIEEMVKVIMGAVPETIQYVQAPANETEARIEAKALIAAGYRKQSDVIDEFMERFLNISLEKSIAGEYGRGFSDCSEIIEKLAAEFGAEVEE